jgi:diguanylate cyclase (GGDEF)-like protein
VFAALLLRRLLSRHQYLQQQYALVKHQATRDQLTGIANRSVFQANIESALARFRRYEIGFVVAFIDLDGFKGINDTYGHIMADKLLGSVADKLVSVVRECDTVARMGGDEFALILSDFRCGSLDILSRKIRDALSSAHRVDGNMILCNASIGFACCPVDGTDMETLVSCADLRMYSQKNDRHIVLDNNASPDPEPAS